MAEFTDFAAKEINNIDVNDSNDDDENNDHDTISSFDVNHDSLDSFTVDYNADLDSYVSEEDDYCLKNITRSVESTLEDVFYESDKLIKSNDEIYNYYNSDEIEKLNNPEQIYEFKDTKKIENFKKTLHVPQGKNLKYFFFYPICYVIRYQKLKK